MEWRCAYARLSIAGNTIGALSDEKGVFILKVPDYLQGDTLQVSHIGYTPKKIPLSLIGEDSLLISLSSQALTLSPVEIVSINSRDTLEKCWRIRDLNYEVQPTLLRGFYQEQMGDIAAESQVLVAEGVLEMYKTPYHRKSNDKVRVLKGRQKLRPQVYTHEGQAYRLPFYQDSSHTKNECLSVSYLIFWYCKKSISSATQTILQINNAAFCRAKR